jgi:hypothetical protein
VAKRITPENIGTALGRLANRIDVWRKQRDELIKEGERLAHIAAGYVQELRGHGTSPSAAPRKNRGGRPKGMKMSEATKAKLREAWKRRKASMEATAGAAPTKAKKAVKRTSVRGARG